MPSNDKTHHPDTVACQAGVAQDPAHRSVSPPLYLSTTFGWTDPESKPTYDYARPANPTRELLEETLAELEDGAKGIVCATGMAAIGLPLNLLKPGDVLLAPHDCYGGTHRLLTALSARGAFEVVFVNQTRAADLDEAFARSPRMVMIETPSNPLMRITDIKDIVTRARKMGALTVADNTFLSPVRQQPLKLGCDLVVHSTTKYINGHSDVIGGAVIAADGKLGNELAWWANATGVVGAPFDSYQTLRGLRTLSIRMDRQEAAATELSRRLIADTRVANVYYPGLESHPGHDIAAVQQSGFGAMMSVDFTDDVDLKSFLQALRIVTLAESLGGFETLVCLPDSMTHAGMAPDARLKAGITPGLARFSIGLEYIDDLWSDIQQALEVAVPC